MPRDLFHARAVQAMNASVELGYNPTIMRRMLESENAVEIAKRMVRSGDIQQGLAELVALGHPELTLESIMLEEQFAPLFTRQELDAARWRLNQAMGILA